MARGPRKPLTPEQKAAHAARGRERYHKARDAGFTPEQSRSIQKAIKQAPEALQAPSEGLLGLMGFLRGAAANLIGDVKPSDKRRTSGKPPEKQKRKPGRKAKNNETQFKRFLTQNPDITKNEAIRRWRAKGKSIGNERATDIYRGKRQREKNVKKINRYHFISPAEAGRNYTGLTGRYIYLVRYEVVAVDEDGDDELLDTFDDYLTIVDNRVLTMREIRDAVLQAFEEGRKYEKYRAVRVVPGSVVLIYAVDTEMQ